MVAVLVLVPLARNIIGKALPHDKLGEVVRVVGHVVHAHAADLVVHLLVPVHVVGDGAKETGAVAAHLHHLPLALPPEVVHKLKFTLEARGPPCRTSLIVAVVPIRARVHVVATRTGRLFCTTLPIILGSVFGLLMVRCRLGGRALRRDFIFGSLLQCSGELGPRGLTGNVAHD